MHAQAMDQQIAVGATYHRQKSHQPSIPPGADVEKVLLDDLNIIPFCRPIHSMPEGHQFFGTYGKIFSHHHPFEGCLILLTAHDSSQ